MRAREGRLLRFRCHTGHAYTASSLALSVSGAAESHLYRAMRALEKASLLFGQLEQRQRELRQATCG